MRFTETGIEGAYIVENGLFHDQRGLFRKVFHADSFEDENLNFEIRESYVSVSKLNVVRGMHFQIPPYDHEKMVYVPKGRILDVVLDIRRESNTYGKYISVELSDKNGMAMYIPVGCAHGFLSLENDSITVYNVSSVYNYDCDCGIRWDSFGYDWNVSNPILSERDLNFLTLEQFEKKNPF